MWSEKDRKYVYVDVFAIFLQNIAFGGTKKPPQGGHIGATTLMETPEKQGYPLWKKKKKKKHF